MIGVPNARLEGYSAGQAMRLPDPNETPIDGHQVLSETIREVTAYNAGDPKQTWGDPCISASGENICNALQNGEKRCAANFVALGTALHIDKFGVCLVTDRMNRRYRNRVDIAMKSDEYTKARRFGKQKLRVQILKKVVRDSVAGVNQD
jgi:3D (Asp-Asp-Asp) domain-containing protein